MQALHLLPPGLSGNCAVAAPYSTRITRKHRLLRNVWRHSKERSVKVRPSKIAAKRLLLLPIENQESVIGPLVRHNREMPAFPSLSTCRVHHSVTTEETEDQAVPTPSVFIWKKLTAPRVRVRSEPKVKKQRVSLGIYLRRPSGAAVSPRG